MTPGALIAQLINGLADASGLFLVAAGLSLIFGVSRLVNFAHGSLYMVGAYVACSVLRAFGPSVPTLALAVVIAVAVVTLLGVAIERGLIARLYGASDLLQLLATFGVMLVVRDAALYLWGADDRFAPRINWLSSPITLADHPFPLYDVLQLVLACCVLAGLALLVGLTRFGRLVRAASEDRGMLGALGVNPKRLSTAVFALGSGLAGLGGAFATTRLPASLSLDIDTIVPAFVVVVVGGLGSIPGAFLAALAIGVARSLCIALGDVSVLGITIAMPRVTLVVEFIVMALVLAWRPQGLFGRAIVAADAAQAGTGVRVDPAFLRTLAPGLAVLLAILPLVTTAVPYVVILTTEILIAALYASSLQLLVGPAGLASFGHAAYFGLGAYGAAWLLQDAHLSMPVALAAAPLIAGLAAALIGSIVVRLSGIYLAMLSLSAAQIAWAIAYQWDAVTGGSTGMVGIWPPRALSQPIAYYALTATLFALVLAGLWRLPATPFGLALRAARDHAPRAEALGVDTRRVRWLAFLIAGTLAGLAGALYAFSKGSVSPEVIDVDRSVNGLVMVVLGGASSVVGASFGAAFLTGLTDYLSRSLEYWHAVLGALIIAVVLIAPGGLAGAWGTRWKTRGRP